MRSFIYVLSPLLFLLIVPSADCAQAVRVSTCWAERILAHSSFRHQLSHGTLAQVELRDAVQAFKIILSKYGGTNGTAWMGLARAQARLGQYDEAADSYTQAQALLSGQESLRRELGRVRDQQAIARAASIALPSGEKVLQALPYPARPDTDLWAVLSASIKRREGEPHPPWPDITGGHLTIFQGRPDSLKQIWRSGTLGYPGHTGGEFNDIYLYVHDVTGNGNVDLVVTEAFIGADWIPSHIDIFRWVGNSLHHLLGAVSDDEPVMKDLRQDGRYEAMTYHSVGRGLSHAEQPQWLDIYAYEKGTYQIADESFASQYHQLYREILTQLGKHPNDMELLYYLGRIREIQRRPRAALRAYKRSEQIAAREVEVDRQEKDQADLSHAASDLQEIRARISRLGRRSR
jgi:tetratricopeptide (TPR) repeat protein